MTGHPRPHLATPPTVPPRLGQVRAHISSAADSNSHLLQLLAAGLPEDDANRHLIGHAGSRTEDVPAPGGGNVAGHGDE